MNLTDDGSGKHTKDYSADVATAPLRLLTAFGKDFVLPLLVALVIGWALLA